MSTILVKNSLIDIISVLEKDMGTKLVFYEFKVFGPQNISQVLHFIILYHKFNPLIFQTMNSGKVISQHLKGCQDIEL